MRQREIRTIVNNCSVHLQRQEKISDQSSNTQEKKYSVVNISRGGICFQSNESFELNELINLKLCVKQQSVHCAKGRICYRNRLETNEASQYGLSFLDNFIDTDVLRVETD